MSIVAETYRYVVGVDTHAATHTYAVVRCLDGAVLGQATFPTTSAGLARARGWVARRTAGELDSVLIAVEGTGSYGAVAAAELAQVGYRVLEAPTPTRRAPAAKSDTLDALAAARSTLGLELSQLRDRRGGGQHAASRAALQVLCSAREHLNADRLWCINALTALTRAHRLGIDARQPLSSTQIATIAAWRRRTEPIDLATARAEAVRLAKRIRELDTDLANNRTQTEALVTEQAPRLLTLPGVGAITAAVVLTAWSHPGRIRTEAAFAAIAGTCPLEASSGKTTRHRLNRGGDRRLNRALNTIVLTRMRTDPATRAYIERRTREGKTRREIRRCLKRYTTRQLYRTLNRQLPALDAT